MPALLLGQFPVLSEFLTDNREVLADEDGAFPDWVELWNPTAEAIDLTGYTLTDDPVTATKWTFPTGTLLQPDERLIVFASGKNRAVAGQPLHTGFALASDGGSYLALFAPGRSEPVSSFVGYPGQKEDVSYGISSGERTEFLVSSGDACRWWVPRNDVGDSWRAPDFDDGAWSEGQVGLGFDLAGDYDPYILTDVGDDMIGVNGSLFVRIPFEVEDPAAMRSLRIKARYDDAFVAYINGEEVAASLLAPGFLSWTSLALDSTEASIDAEFEIRADFAGLRAGTNILSIHALNSTSRSSDFLIHPELQGTFVSEDPASGFFLRPTPGEANREGLEGFVKDTRFSSDRGFYDEPFDLVLSSRTEGAQIRYTVDGTDPTPTRGILYNEPIRIDASTIVRALAFKRGMESTNIDTQTYLFSEEVADQAVMNTRISSGLAYRETFMADVTETLPVMSLNVDFSGFFGPIGIYERASELEGPNAEIPVSVEYFTPGKPDQSFQVNAGIRIHGGNARSHPKKPLRLFFRGEYGPRRLEYPLFPGSPVNRFDQLVLRAGGHDGWALAQTFGTLPFDIPHNARFDEPVHPEQTR
ncbi:MAG: chitobiase/beta-hexosaminidase C-terminal domain-containing protein, partial [Verrucomicrobiota bacterium]